MHVLNTILRHSGIPLTNMQKMVAMMVVSMTVKTNVVVGRDPLGRLDIGASFLCWRVELSCVCLSDWW